MKERHLRRETAWATGYNVVALPLAAGVLAPFGFLLSLALGAVFMTLSTIIVAINAQLLRRINFNSYVRAPGWSTAQPGYAALADA